MRQAIATLTIGLLLAGCGGSGEVDPPEVSITEASWDGDEVTLEVGSNLPDDAILSWYVIEGDDWDDLDAADTDGFMTVSDGAATTTVEVAEFSADEAMVEVVFVASYNEQPEDIQDAYGPPFTERDWPADWKEDAADERSVSRG